MKSVADLDTLLCSAVTLASGRLPLESVKVLIESQRSIAIPCSS